MGLFVMGVCVGGVGVVCILGAFSGIIMLKLYGGGP